MALSTTGCVSTLLSVATGHGLNWGSGSGSSDNSGYVDYDDPSARASQEEVQQQQGWELEQQIQQTQDAANQQTIQASIDTANAAAATAAAMAAAANP